MTDPLAYAGRQTWRSVWVFALDVPKDQLEPWRHGSFTEDGEHIWPLRDALGVDPLDNDFTEVFQIADIAEYGLARYLIEANRLAEASVAPDAATLGALTGAVALVFSGALGDAPVRLDPQPPLRFIGRYEERPNLAFAPPLHSPEGAGTLAPASAPPVPGPRLPLWPAALLVLLMLLALLAFALT